MRTDKTMAWALTAGLGLGILLPSGALGDVKLSQVDALDLGTPNSVGVLAEIIPTASDIPACTVALGAPGASSSLPGLSLVKAPGGPPVPIYGATLAQTLETFAWGISPNGPTSTQVYVDCGDEGSAQGLLAIPPYDPTEAPAPTTVTPTPTVPAPVSPAPTIPAPAPKGVHIVSVTSPMHINARFRLVAKVQGRISRCSLSVLNAKGKRQVSGLLGPKAVHAGRVVWTLSVAPTTSPFFGRFRAVVVCGRLRALASLRVVS